MGGFLSKEHLLEMDPEVFQTLGRAVAARLLDTWFAFYTIDKHGRVVNLQSTGVKLLEPLPREDEELDKLTEDDAIQLMLNENRAEDEILEYLKGRGRRNGAGVL